METILLIEDNINILENLTEYLEMEGYRILIANTGKKGIELAIKCIPDLIVCDVLMPEMDGLTVLRTLLESAQGNKIPFIFSTSVSERIDREESMKLGADGYIVKPFDPGSLVKIIKTIIKTGSKRQHKTTNV